MATIFGSTCLCEQSFSLMKYIKSRGHSHLTDEHLEGNLLIAMSKIENVIDRLMKNKIKSLIRPTVIKLFSFNNYANHYLPFLKKQFLYTSLLKVKLIFLIKHLKTVSFTSFSLQLKFRFWNLMAILFL